MRAGLTISRFLWPGGDAQIGAHLIAIGQAAEEAGFASIWAMDHFFQIGYVGQPEDPMLEGYSVLNFLAAATRRVRLGTLVTGAAYRHPGVLVKTVTSLDVLSGGRAYLGIGAAWNDVEARSLGIPFPPLKERFERLEETLQIAHQMWSDNRTPFHGAHYTLEDPLCHPQPISRPRPRILVGGGGEQKTLRLVARYADACNLFAMPGPDVLRHKLDVLRGHCEAVGRPFEEIELTAMVNTFPGQSASEIVATCRMLAGLGFHHVIFDIPMAHDLSTIAQFGREILPELAAL
ncbi:LLM class F420-dependent oxidoreductase [Chloroflexia bacterium SDU3-3]|nr:LLM class F420-dependent oxidoreductase [Chloroflexia bacterium SDU3-3]